MAERKAALTYIREFPGINYVVDKVGQYKNVVILTVGLASAGYASALYIENQQKNSDNVETLPVTYMVNNKEALNRSQENPRIDISDQIESYQPTIQEHQALVATLEYMLNSNKPELVDAANKYNLAAEAGQSIIRITPPGYFDRPVTVGRIPGIQERIHVDSRALTNIAPYENLSVDDNAASFAQAEQLLEEIKPHLGDYQNELQELKYFASLKQPLLVKVEN